GDGIRNATVTGVQTCALPIWKDPARYEETYWSRWKDVWVHGDWAYVDDDGFWFLQGRSDDTLKIAGKRLGPAEVESVLVGHAAEIGRASCRESGHNEI